MKTFAIINLRLATALFGLLVVGCILAVGWLKEGEP